MNELEPTTEDITEQSPPETTPLSREKLAALEAVLFMAADPISAAELAEILDETPADVERLAQELAALYHGRGLQLMRLAGGFQVGTRPEYGPYVAKLHEPNRFRLSRAALETLAIVAYKQPVTRPEIEAIRGVNPDSPLDTLVQYELVCEAGRKDAPGRPMLYRTTESFLGHFGLNSVADLPNLDTIPVDEEAVKHELAQSAAPPPDSAETIPPEEEISPQDGNLTEAQAEREEMEGQ